VRALTLDDLPERRLDVARAERCVEQRRRAAVFGQASSYAGQALGMSRERDREFLVLRLARRDELG
jgi:hypothetical protein